MKYIQLDIECKPDLVEIITGVLMEKGISDIAISDPLDIKEIRNKKNDYDWDYIDQEVLDIEKTMPKLSVYLDGDEEGAKKAEELESALSSFKDITMEKVIIDDEDWKDKWKEYFKPAKVGEKIVVKPTWEPYEPRAEELVIEIDPGMAFGTGTHETTSLCIKLMEKYISKGDKVLDVGCGSGILAIGAALLGAGEVLGVEIDPVAVKIAEENIRLNKVENVAEAKYGDLTKGVDFKADLVVANLMADLVKLLSEDVAKHMEKEAYYISSGILEEQVVSVADYMRTLGFKILEVKQDGMWCAVVAQK